MLPCCDFFQGEAETRLLKKGGRQSVGGEDEAPGEPLFLFCNIESLFLESESNESFDRVDSPKPFLFSIVTKYAITTNMPRIQFS